MHRMLFSLLINVKMPTIVGILNIYDQEKNSCSTLNIKICITSGPDYFISECPRYVVPSHLFTVRARVIGVPGELKAYKLAHSMYGRLPWRELFQPTIEMLREGFPLAASTAKAMQFLVEIGIQLTDFPLLWYATLF